MRLVGSNGAVRLVLLVTGTAAAALPALTPARAANPGVPFTARLSGTATYANSTTVQFTGEGIATSVGRVTDRGVAVFGAPEGSCPGGVPGLPNDHTETLMAQNGDTLVLQLKNFACPTAPSSLHGTGTWIVVGGTGRFDGATGGGTCDGTADFATNTFEGTIDGRLSLA